MGVMKPLAPCSSRPIALFSLLPLLFACANDSLHALPNHPPTALITAKPMLFLGETALFSGSRSSDPNGDPLTYQWDFGDGRAAIGIESDHIFTEEGFFEITLTVTDNQDLSNTTSVKVLVSENLPPEVEILAPEATLTHRPLLIEGRATDPEGMALTYTWWLGNDPTDEPQAGGSRIETTFTTPGEQLIRLEVFDEVGAATIVEQSIDVVANPFSPGQVWTGSYTCPQGLTQLTLRITGVDLLGVVAVFDFLHEASASNGDYDMHGSFNPATNRVEFFPDSWNNRPTGYRDVGMLGTVTETEEGITFDGDITEPGCGTFSVTLGEEE